MPTHEYEKVALVIKARIRDGTYPPGSRLPSRTQLREEFGVSDSPINGAMRILRAQGLIETLIGAAVCVADPLPPP